jgi:SAM-dependent methyltransferase
MDSKDWDSRYAGTELLWRSEPNQFLVEEVSDLPPGRALDVACGEGRNAVWLAERGWQASGVDFSPVALAKAACLAGERGVKVDWIEADLAEWVPPARAFDLVVVFYLQLPPALRTEVYGRMAEAVAPDGTILVVGHDRDNLSAGYGGPQDPEVLLGAEEVAGDLSGLKILKAEQVRRRVDTEAGPKTAIDTLVRAMRQADGGRPG